MAVVALVLLDEAVSIRNEQANSCSLHIKTKDTETTLRSLCRNFLTEAKNSWDYIASTPPGQNVVQAIGGV